MTTLVNCRRCRNVVAAGAPVCMRCGEPTEKSERQCPSCQEPATAGAKFCSNCGKDLSAKPPEADLATPPHGFTQPLTPFVESWKPNRRTLVISVIAVTVLVVLSAVLFAVQKAVYTPESALRGYFGALADHDAEKALSYATEDDSSSEKVTETIKSPGYVPPTGLEIQELSGDGEKRSATISYVIGEQKYSTKVELSQRKTRSLGLFRDWQVATTQPQLEVKITTADAPIRINGVIVGTAETDRNGVALRTPMFPGRYMVDIADNPLLESDPVFVDIGPDGAEVTLSPRTKASAQEATENQVKDYVNGCAATIAQPSTANCPFVARSDDPRAEAAWRIDTYPAIELRTDSSGNFGVRTRSSGQATLTAKQFDGSPYQRTTSFTISGSLTLDQGKIVFLPE